MSGITGMELYTQHWSFEDAGDREFPRLVGGLRIDGAAWRCLVAPRECLFRIDALDCHGIPTLVRHDEIRAHLAMHGVQV